MHDLAVTSASSPAHAAQDETAELGVRLGIHPPLTVGALAPFEPA